MGLDMYLYARKYVSGYNFQPENQKTEYLALKAIDPIMAAMSTDESPHGEILINVAYWRKSNQIHKWFVDRVQGGVDECQPSARFGRDVLIELLGICNQILRTDSGDIAEELLPTQSGFFFGSTDYDEYYLEDIKHTVERLTTILEATEDHPHDYVFQYQSSW